MRPPQEVRLRQETIDHLTEKMSEAVASGIAKAVADIQAQATQRVGGFVLGGLAGLAQRISVFIVLGGVVYAFGGWDAIGSFFKTYVLGHG
jgi:uncharacterized membrane protein required for colicin V production